MTKSFHTDSDKIITLRQIASYVNNANLDDDIVVMEGVRPFDMRDSFPLRLDSLMLILCNGGHGRIGIDLQEYDITGHTLIIIQPQNYIYLSELSNDCVTNVVCCSSHIVEDVLPRYTDILPFIMHHRSDPILRLNDSEAFSLNSFFTYLKQKIEGPRTPFIKKKLICMLQAAFYELMDLDMVNNNIPREQRSRKEEIMVKFIMSVSENFRTHRQVTFYSDQLSITPKHLSTVVKTISGRTAGEWIENYVTLEAKVLLKSTNLSILEIASKLNFTNQSFFGKYFKHQTGMSPSEYRRRNS